MPNTLTKDHHLWTRDTVKNVTGNVTLDIAGDITLDSAGQQIYFKSGDNSWIDFDYVNSKITMYQVGQTADYAWFDVESNGQLQIGTLKYGLGTTAHLHLSINGDIDLQSDSGNITYQTTGGTDQLLFDLDTTSGQIDVRLKVDGDDLVFKQYDGNEVMRIADDRKVYFYDKGGEYIDADGTDMAINGGNDITLDAGGDVVLDAAGDNIKMLGSGGSGLDFIQSGTGDYTIKNLTSDKDIIFNVNDGGADTEVMRLDGDVGSVKVANILYFAAETANTIGDGATGAIDWNVSQKQKLTITGTGITVNFTDPGGACNLLLRVAQGDGSDVVGTWDADIKWAGGSAPTLSTGNGEIDILSFYWDGSKYYGVASLNFS